MVTTRTFQHRLSEGQLGRDGHRQLRVSTPGNPPSEGSPPRPQETATSKPLVSTPGIPLRDPHHKEADAKVWLMKFQHRGSLPLRDPHISIWPSYRTIAWFQHRGSLRGIPTQSRQHRGTCCDTFQHRGSLRGIPTRHHRHYVATLHVSTPGDPSLRRRGHLRSECFNTGEPLPRKPLQDCCFNTGGTLRGIPTHLARELASALSLFQHRGLRQHRRVSTTEPEGSPPRPQPVTQPDHPKPKPFNTGEPSEESPPLRLHRHHDRQAVSTPGIP